MIINDTPAVDMVEFYISKAQILYNQGSVPKAIDVAQTALNLLKTNPSAQREVAINLFIARAKSSLGHYEESNKIYRGLISEDAYLPPIILGILHNNLQLQRDEKVTKNVNLLKLIFPSEGWS